MARVDVRILVCAFALSLPVSASAGEDEDELPDMAFLEYLGMWEESDEEWLLLDDDVLADNEERIDPAPDGEASTEIEDES